MLAKENLLLLAIISWLILRFVIAPWKTYKLQLTYNPNSKFAQTLVQQTFITHLKYQPYWLIAISRHLQGIVQTFYCSVIENYPRFQEVFEREILALKDGGLVAIDWHQGMIIPACCTKKSDDLVYDKKPILVCFPGLGGGTHSAYIRQVIRECKDEFKCVVVNWRNTEGLPITTSKMYEMNSWQDFKASIDHINLKYKPVQGIYLYACSFGAVCASRYLIEDNQNSPVRAATFYGALFDPIGSHDFFTNSGYGFYSYVFGCGVVEKFEIYLKELEKFTSKELLESYNQVLTKKVPAYLYNTDQYIIAPMFGYKDRVDYYTKSAIKGNLSKIRVPCLYLHSWDDIVIDPKSIPIEEIQSSENIILAATTQGGHCCHLMTGKFGLLPAQWFQKPIGEFLRFAKRYK